MVGSTGSTQAFFTKALMTKAFRGYINYIKDDDDEAPKAWAYATHVDLQDLLLTAWKGVRRDLLQTTNESDPILTDIFPDIDSTTEPTLDPTTDPTNKYPTNPGAHCNCFAICKPLNNC